MMKRQATRGKQFLLERRDAVRDWRPPGPARIKQFIGDFFSNLTTGFRTDHTLVSLVSPVEDDEALTDMQVVQLFWSVLMIDLYVNCAQYSGPTDPTEPPGPRNIINDFVNGFIGAMITVFIVLCLRYLFRWGNKRRLPERKNKEGIKGLLKKMIKGLRNCKFRIPSRKAGKGGRKRAKTDPQYQPPTRVQRTPSMLLRAATGSFKLPEKTVHEVRIMRSLRALRNIPMAEEGASASAPAPAAPAAAPTAKELNAVKAKLAGGKMLTDAELEQLKSAAAAAPPAPADAAPSPGKSLLAAFTKPSYPAVLPAARKVEKETPPPPPPRERVVEVVKEAGEPTKLGLQPKAGGLFLAYVEEDSIFAGRVNAGDEIISINGTAVSGAREAAAALREASELRVRVRAPPPSAALVRAVGAMRAARAFAKPTSPPPSPPQPAEEEPQPAKPSLKRTASSLNASMKQAAMATRFLKRQNTEALAEETGVSAQSLRKGLNSWQKRLTVDVGWALASKQAEEMTSPDGKALTDLEKRKTIAKIRARNSFKAAQKKKDTRVADKLKEVRMRSDCVYYTRQGLAWFFNWLTYLWIGWTVFVYCAIFGPYAAASIIEGWFISLGFAVGVIEPLNILCVALLPLLLSEDGPCMKCYNNVFFFWNEYLS